MKKRQVQDLLAEMGVDPFTSLALIASKAERDGDLKTAATCHKELAKYCEPQLKSVDMSVGSREPIKLELVPIEVGSTTETK